MKQSFSNSVMQRYGLIPRDISRQILWAIKSNPPIDKLTTYSYIPSEKIMYLREMYNKKKSQILVDENSPRNIIFYHMIKDIIPDYKWYINGKHVLFDMPKIAGVEPSLLSLLLWSTETPIIKSEFSYICQHILSDYPNVFNNIESLFDEIQAITPSKNQMLLFIKWIKEGLNGKNLNIFALACPDYSTEPTNMPLCPHRHTFKNVGNGIGMVAKRILEVNPKLAEFFSKNNIKFNQNMAMADYEILSKTTRDRLKISQETFLNRLKNSVAAFKTHSPHINSFMLSELCGGLNEWDKLYKYYREKFSNGDFGKSNLNMKKIIELTQSRQNFYERWFGIQDKFEDYISILLNQGAEYTAVANIVSKHFPNCLILGADNSLFSEFYCVDKEIPTLYLKRFYC